MSGYSTKKADDGSYSVVDSLGFVVSTGWSEADANYQAQQADRGTEQYNTSIGKPNQGSTEDMGSTNDRGVPEGYTSSQLSGKKPELGIFGKIFTFLACAVVFIVAIFVALSIFGWAIATFVAK
jgi:hypothetical protein